MNAENHANRNEQSFPPNTMRACIPVFIGTTIGNLIGDRLFDLEFSDTSAPIRGGIATALLYVYGKATTRQ